MLGVNVLILFATVHCGLCYKENIAKRTSLEADYPVQKQNNLKSSLGEIAQNFDFNGERNVRHIGVGGVIGGVKVIGDSAEPIYAAPPVTYLSTVPVITSLPVITQVPSYPVYGGGYRGYGGSYGGGFGGFGAGFGVAKFKVKGFGIGGGFLG